MPAEVRNAEGLTRRQAAFVEAYFPEMNGRKAAVAAGYSSRTTHGIVSRLLSNVVVHAAIEKRRAAFLATIRAPRVATMAQIRERLSEQLEGRRFTQDIAELEAELAEIDTAIADVKKALEDPTIEGAQRLAARETILRQRSRRFSRRVEIKRLKLAMDQESNRAAMDLARLKGALDPHRKLHGDRKEVLDAFITTLVKVTDGKSLTAKLEAAVPIEATFTTEREPQPR